MGDYVDRAEQSIEGKKYKKTIPHVAVFAVDRSHRVVLFLFLAQWSA
jgi:hypothetical protein